MSKETGRVDLREIIKIAAGWFDEYAQQHLDKTPPDRIKAARDYAIEKLEEILALAALASEPEKVEHPSGRIEAMAEAHDAATGGLLRMAFLSTLDFNPTPEVWKDFSVKAMKAALTAGPPPAPDPELEDACVRIEALLEAWDRRELRINNGALPAAMHWEAQDASDLRTILKALKAQA